MKLMMTKEELKKEAKDSWWNDNNCSGALSTEKIYECGYLASAEPREKRIAELEKSNTSLLSSVENLNKSVQELEAQIKKMKCCGNCAKYNSGYGENPCKIGASMICGEWETSIGKF